MGFWTVVAWAFSVILSFLIGVYLAGNAFIRMVEERDLLIKVLIASMKAVIGSSTESEDKNGNPSASGESLN